MKRFLLILTLSAICITKAEAFNWSALSTWFGTSQVNQTVSETQNQVTNQVVNNTENALNALASIQQQADAIDASVQSNFLSIVSLLSSKKETNSIKSQLSSIMSDSNKTSSEKSELFNQILTSYVSDLSNTSSTTKKLKKLSAPEKLQLVQQITSMEQSGQRYASLAKQVITTTATNVLQSASNNNGTTDFASIISQTNQTASLIKTKATNTINLVNQLRTLTSAAGLTN